MRVVQVSDCHLSCDAAAAYRGQSADRNLASLLPAIRRWQPDLMLLTGDVSEDGSTASYGRASARLGTAGAPVLALPGNHDDPAVMRRFFPSGPWTGPFVFERANWQIVLLDSLQPGAVAGAITTASLRELDRCLVEGRSAHVLLALHHQPVPVGSHWIDRYPLEDPDAFLSVVDRHPRIRCVTWGHVHQDFDARRGEVVLLGSPSSVANTLPRRDVFTPDLGGPACRWFELAPDGAMETGILRAGGPV